MEKDEQLTSKDVPATGKKTSVEKREEYIDNLTTKLKKWNRDLEKFEANNEKTIAELRQKMDKNISYLKDKRDRLSQKLGQVENVSKENFKEIRKDLDALWKDLKKGFSDLRKELKSDQ